MKKLRSEHPGQAGFKTLSRAELKNVSGGHPDPLCARAAQSCATKPCCEFLECDPLTLKCLYM